jgi:glycosyltransferase involved in cell wall biosynthesis
LKDSDVVISTAMQENFGISVVEAAYCGAFPLLPRGLSYPELIPARYHGDHFYSNIEELVLTLKSVLRNSRLRRERQKVLSPSLFRFDWSKMIQKWDSIIDSLVSSGAKKKRK